MAILKKMSNGRFAVDNGKGSARVVSRFEIVQTKKGLSVRALKSPKRKVKRARKVARKGASRKRGKRK